MKTLAHVFILISINLSFAQGLENENDEVNIITTDVDNFWKAFDEFKRDTATNAFQIYLDNASVGLKDFIQWHIDTGTHLKKTIRRELQYYEKARPYSYEILQHKETIKKYFQAFKEIYPYAVYPDIYAVVGVMNSGGTSSQHGIIIGTEMFGDSTLQSTNCYKGIPLEKIPEIVATGLVFYHQKPAPTGYTLLRQSIIHGSADFLVSLVLGEKKHLILERENYKYGELHEEELVKQFLREKDSENLTDWLFQGKTKDGKPSDLGIWFGYKVTEAYYNNSPDKVKAIDEILKINDFGRFLTLSGYTAPFEN
jgi:hypothetical protein